MRKIFILLALTFVLGSCDNGDMENGDDETNPFVGIWEGPPEGIRQIIFTADGKTEFRSFTWLAGSNSYGLLINYFGTYTYEGKQAVIDWDYNVPNTVIFDIDTTLYKKTKKPMITTWI